jgi:hypothetical protein
MLHLIYDPETMCYMFENFRIVNIISSLGLLQGPSARRTVKTKQEPLTASDRTTYRTLSPERTLFKMR